MISKKVMGWSAIIISALIVLTTTNNWNPSLNYLWAVFVAIWGFISLHQL